MKKNKAKINYWVDVVLAVTFLLSAVSGIVLYAVPMGGYQGGRNPFYGREVLFMGHDAWTDLHTVSSLVMVAGVLAHLVLHWNWMVCMTRNVIWGAKAARAVKSCETADVAASAASVSSPKLQIR